MKVCFLNRGRETHPGGDVLALDATMAALRRKGVHVEETGWDVERMKAGEFDLAHVFHCNFDWSFGNARAVRAAGLKYVLTPIFYEGLLSGITSEELKWIIYTAERVLPFSKREVSEVRVAAFLHPHPSIIIPNGTDPIFHDTSDAMKRIGVLCVSARGENDKGIPQVKAICEKLRFPFTCITGIPHDQLPPIYKAYRLFVNNSDSERMSLTVGEALCAGCRVVSNHGNRGSEHFRNLVVDYIHEDLIARSYNLPDWDYLPNHDARQLTWDLVADRLIKVYEEVLR